MGIAKRLFHRLTKKPTVFIILFDHNFYFFELVPILHKYKRNIDYNETVLDELYPYYPKEIRLEVWNPKLLTFIHLIISNHAHWKYEKLKILVSSII
jgi:hypothetical protein